MKHFLKTFFTILLIAFIIIQFFRPEENKSAVIAENDLTKKFTVPADVNNILKASCTDFHSSNTDYPFYFKVQPLAWILADHIKTGKTQFL